MGKVRPDFIKRIARELIEKEPLLYTMNFEENKEILNQIAEIKTKRLRNRLMMPDVFQGVYFGNVASVFRGKEIFQLRRELGLGLTAQYPESRADVVIPNPESGWGVTVGVAEGLKKQLLPALIKLPQAVVEIRSCQDFHGRRLAPYADPNPKNRSS